MATSEMRVDRAHNAPPWRGNEQSGLAVVSRKAGWMSASASGHLCGVTGVMTQHGPLALEDRKCRK